MATLLRRCYSPTKPSGLFNSKDRMRAAFFQRFFARYQGGLIDALSSSQKHDYVFYGDNVDPEDSGIEVYPFREGMRYEICRTFHLSLHFALQWRAVTAAMGNRFDAIILEGSFTLITNWLAIMAARITGKRVLLYGHGWPRRANGLRERVRLVFYNFADGLLIYGRRARQIGIEKGFDPSKLYVVYNSLNEKELLYHRRLVSEERCQALKKELFGKTATWPLLICVGRLTAAKQLDLLLEAVKQIRRREQDLNILLVGDGPERKALQAQATEEGLSVHFTGAVHDEASLSIYFSASDATVIPGAAGLTAIHSLAYGTPIITHDDMDSQMPEAEAVIPGETGFYYRKGDVDSLVRSINETLLQLPRSETTRRKCMSIVDKYYNPRRMQRVFDEAVSSIPDSDT